MCHHKNKSAALAALLASTLCLLALWPARAATTIYVGTNGVSATTNWSSSVNFVDATAHTPETPANNAANFSWDTAVSVPGKVTLHADGAYNSPGSGNPNAWGIFFDQTNGYHTVQIDAGIQLQMIAASGTPGGGGFEVAPMNRNSGGNGSGNTVGTGPYTNYTTMFGPGSFLINGTFRIEAGDANVENHYAIFDMSSLGTFIQTNTTPTTAERFLLLNGSTRGQALVYFATNNFVYNSSDVQIGWNSTSSNSLPVGLYLGMTNYIVTGPEGNGNQLVVGIDGITNAFMKFNPKFLGGATKPMAYLSGNGSGVSGMMNWVAIGQAGGRVRANAVADFTGGVVTWAINGLHLGRSTTLLPDTTALGMLTFDSGTITVLTGDIGEQETSAGSPCQGVLNIGTNATFTAVNTLYVPYITGTPNASSYGIINVNGGTLNVLGNILDTNNLGTLNISNSALGLTLPTVSATATNIFIGTLGVAGTANLINISSITPFLGGNASIATPIRFHLLHYATLNGTMNVSLGSLPASYNPSYTYGGYIDTITTPNTIDFVLTNAPPGARTLVWSGTNGVANPDGDWDLALTPDWVFGGAATIYNQFDLANFNDIASPAQTNINLTTTVTPYSLTISNNASTYTFSGGGQISGTTSLIKQGPGTLILDENGSVAGYNNFSGNIGISGGIVQVGNGDEEGTLSTGNVTNNGNLVFDMGANPAVSNLISGTGNVIQAGGDTLQLAGANTFTGSVVVSNNSTLQVGNQSAFGTINGSTIILNGSTLDMNAFNTGSVEGKPVNVQGAGVDGNGALINNNNSAGGFLTNVTLSGDTAIGGSARLDIGGTLSTGGHGYNVTVTGSAYHEWSNLTVDTNLANITINGSATLGDKGTTALGNPASAVTVAPGATLVFYNNGTSYVNLNKNVVIDDGGTLDNGGGASTIAGSVLLTNVDGSGTPDCTFNIGSISVNLKGALSGDGILDFDSGSGTLTISGNSPLFTGGAVCTSGTLVINTNFGSGPVTCYNSSTLEGTGTAGGLVDTYGNLYPGALGTAGTFNAAGGLTLESSANLTMDLNSTTGVGGGTNDLIVVTGDLTVNGIFININPLANMPNGSTYTLFTYTGNLNGSFAGAATVQTSQYTFQINNITGTTPKQIQLVVTGGQPGPLLWNNASSDGEWDVQNSQNWSNLTTHVAADYFYSFDSVTFDDSITNSATPSTSIDVGTGQVVLPSVITNNSTTNYLISGVGKISGAASLVKLGSSTLSISNMPNDFTGNITIAGGTLRAWWGPSELGSTNGFIYITNGGTLDRGWSTVRPIVVSGSGVGGAGAIVNFSGANVIYDGASGGLTPSLTLAGNTAFGGNTRTDLGGTAGATVTCLGGGNYNIAISNSPGIYNEWDNLTIDTNLGNIDIYTTGGGSTGIKGCGLSLGNPTNVITVHTGSELTFWGETANNSGYAKNIHVMSNSIVQFRPQNPNNYYNTTLSLDNNSEMDCFNGSGNGTVFLQPVSLNGMVHFVIGDSAVTFSNVVSGLGGFYFISDNNSIVFTGTNTYQGPTIVGSGMLVSLAANGSIAGSSNIDLASGGVMIVTNRVDGTLTLASSQTLQGGGSLQGFLTSGAGSMVAPGTNGITGTLTVSSNTTLNGAALLKLNSPTNDVLSVGGTLYYGGTLTATNISVTTLAAGNSFKLFKAAAYSGNFAATNLPALGTGLGWNWSPTNGVLSVVQTVNLTPTNILATVSGNVLTLSWPSDHIGWQLQVQTNSLSSGLNPPGTWYTVPGSASVDTENITLDPSQGTVFYRMYISP